VGGWGFWPGWSLLLLLGLSGIWTSLAVLSGCWLVWAGSVGVWGSGGLGVGLWLGWGSLMVWDDGCCLAPVGRGTGCGCCFCCVLLSAWSWLAIVLLGLSGLFFGMLLGWTGVMVGLGLGCIFWAAGLGTGFWLALLGGGWPPVGGLLLWLAWLRGLFVAVASLACCAGMPGSWGTAAGWGGGGLAWGWGHVCLPGHVCHLLLLVARLLALVWACCGAGCCWLGCHMLLLAAGLAAWMEAVCGWMSTGWLGWGWNRGWLWLPLIVGRAGLVGLWDDLWIWVAWPRMACMGVATEVLVCCMLCPLSLLGLLLWTPLGNGLATCAPGHGGILASCWADAAAGAGRVI